MSRARKTKKDSLNEKQLIAEFGLTKAIIRKYFPPATRHTFKNTKGYYVTRKEWPRQEVEAVVKRPEVAKALANLRREHWEQEQREEIRELFMGFSPDAYIDRAKTLQRAFVLHVGPTNSGKTYDAIEDLKQHLPGTYLGPLRLLALEMYDKLNGAGIPCTMVTGEETLPVEGAQVVSSTIELCDCHTRFKTAVIDEAQLIADSTRGAAWLKALCLVDAEVVHVCMAPEALSYVERMVRSFGSHYRIVRHERLSPLVYAGRCRGFSDIRPGDGVICFSRKNVLSTAALLERHGFNASVIYGALPPEARRNEVRKYLSGETNLVVATDAIGLGISLPIQRVIFAETEKFDGKQIRPLSTAEINQIGGRAGRYGYSQYGEVLSMGDAELVENRLGKQAPAIKAACIAFPKEVLQSGYPLPLLLRCWQSMPKSQTFIREDMREAQTLLQALSRRWDVEKDRETVFELISCPIDTHTEELVGYWTDCAVAILRGRPVPEPPFETETLLGCELQYKAYDVYHQILRRFGMPDDSRDKRREICDRIAALMRESKAQYIRHCRGCGRELPLGNPYNVCEKCFRALSG